MEQTSIKENWINVISGLDITSREMYLLINPLTDVDKYFALVEKIVDERIFTLDHCGKVEDNQKKIFRALAARYLTELEKEKSSFINTGSFSPWTYPINLPGYPITTDPVTVPGRPDITYCTHGTYQINS